MYKRVGVVYVIVSLVSLIVFAQPSQDDIGARSRIIEKELERMEKEFKKIPPVSQIEIQKEKKEIPPTQMTFLLKNIKIAGSTIFSQQDFYPLYKDYLNKEITFSDLEEIVNKINLKYQNAGYLTTEAYIPQQEFKDEVVEIIIEEGKVNQIKTEGNRYLSTDFIQKHIYFKKNEVFNINKLKKGLIRLNRIPKVIVKANISAAELPSASDITLKIVERFPWKIGFSVDNQGSNLTGKIRTNYFIENASCSGRADLLLLNTQKTSRSTAQSLIYQLPINTYDKRFGLTFSYLTMELGKEYKHLKIIGQSYLFKPYIIKELFLSEISSVDLEGGLKIKSTDKEISGETITNEELRIPYFSLQFNSYDHLGYTLFSPTFNFGTEDFLGASSMGHLSGSRDNTGGFFFKYEHNLQRIQKMPFDSFITLTSNFQYSTHTLPSSEQFQLGGVNSVRGYPEGDYLADIGGSLSLEWLFPSYFIPKNWKLKNRDTFLREEIQPVFFIDFGAGRLLDTESNERRTKSLLGIGGGLRLRVIKGSYLRLDWAKVLLDEPASGAGPSTFYFSFQYEL